MSNDDLLDLMVASIITGNRDTTAQKVRDLITAMIGSYQNIDGKDQADGYLSINGNGNANFSLIKALSPVGGFLRDDGSFQGISTVQNLTNGSSMTPDINNYVYSSAGAASWTTVATQGNKKYSVWNRGSGILTLNYPGGVGKIYRMSTGTAASSATVAIGGKVDILDDGNFLMIV